MALKKTHVGAGIAGLAAVIVALLVLLLGVGTGPTLDY